MRWLDVVRLRLRSLLRRSRVEAELDEELRFHLDQQAQAFAARGLPPDDARHAALRAMGGVDQRKEECRDARRVSRRAVHTAVRACLDPRPTRTRGAAAT